MRKEACCFGMLQRTGEMKIVDAAFGNIIVSGLRGDVAN
jgi:hypothetical protein